MARAAVVAVAVLLACLPPPAVATSPYRAVAALRRLETAAPMDTAQGMRQKADVAEVAAENLSTTGFGTESKRFVPTGSNPLHNHGKGPTRQVVAAENVSTKGLGVESKRFVPTGSNPLHNHSRGPTRHAAAENVSTTGFGTESKRFVPTGSNPLHNHSQGPRRESP
ncbi:unnamed protein product [Urochloa humidicola]